MSIWVANAGSNKVNKLRPSDGASLGTFPIGASPIAIVFDGTSMWVANLNSNNVSRLPAR